MAEPLLQTVADKAILIFSGEGGREILADTLQARGAKVTKVATYRRLCPQANLAALLPSWEISGLNVIISTSNESLQNLVKLAGDDASEWLCRKVLIVISERMAQFAQTLGFTRIMISTNASDAAIVQVLTTIKFAKKSQLR